MFIAGDPSGDHHASAVVSRLLEINPEYRCYGIGGPAMCSAGFEALMPFEPFNRMGFTEVISHLSFFLGAKRKLIDVMRKRRPDCLVCVDYSGFNIPMMKAARALGIPVVWYIAPMVWAWKRKRAAILGRYATHICCIFPFEVPFFTPYSDSVSFVGNPLVEELDAKEKHRSPDEIAFPREPVLALVPGSRAQEISRMLPPMAGAYKLLKAKYPLCRGYVSRYGTHSEEVFRKACEGTDLVLHTGPLGDLLSMADLAVVTSGTATLETALMGIPHVIAYRTSAVTYALFRRFLTISHIGLPNIVAEESVAPECIQQYVTELELSRFLERFLSDEYYYRMTAGKLLKTRELLGSKKPSSEVARIVDRVVRRG